MNRCVKLLKQGYAMKIKDYESIPYRHIKDIYMDNIDIKDLALLLNEDPRRISRMINLNARPTTDFVAKYLDLFGLNMVLLKDDKLYSEDLKISHLIKSKHLLAKQIGVSNSYFYNSTDNYRIDIFIKTLDYFGLELAIMQ